MSKRTRQPQARQHTGSRPWWALTALALSPALLSAQPTPPTTTDTAEGWVLWDEQGAEALKEERAGGGEVIEVTVEGEREARASARGASDVVVGREVLAAAPKSEGAEVLRAAPGLYIGRAMGPAVAHSYTLRGFNADHGQDIAFSVAGVPINLPSHIHGQGYADLGLLVGGVVSELEVLEGVYDPQQGDFAVAGSINVSLAVPQGERGQRLELGLGAFGTQALTARWAPHTLPDKSFAVVSLEQSEGFGEQRAGESATLLAQHELTFGRSSLTLFVGARGARSAVAGVVRRDDVEAGVVCFECAYDLPTARAQGAFNQRLMASAQLDHKEADGGRFGLSLWASVDHFRAQHNFTGFLERSRSLLNTSGRGDLIEQRNSTSSLGLSSSHLSAPLRAWGARFVLELGGSARLDSVAQEQSLLDASSRLQTWDERVRANISGLDLAAWLDLEVEASLLKRPLKLNLGARAATLSYEVEDELGNFTPASRPSDTYLVGYRRSAQGSVAGPRLSAQWQVSAPLTLLAAYGEGYRSPQARTLEDGEEAPFTKVRSTDVGFKLALAERLELGLGGYLTTLSDDVSFDPSEGRLERVGASERLGGVLHVVWRPTRWALLAGSVTGVKATLLEPPPATAEEPQPPFLKGERLPFVAPFVSRLDASMRGQVASLWGRALIGQLGVGASHLSERPLPFGEWSPQVLLLDASAGLSWAPPKRSSAQLSEGGEWSLSVAMFNMLNERYAAQEWVFASDWSPQSGTRSRLPTRHISAGAPRAWGLTLAWRR